MNRDQVLQQAATMSGCSTAQVTAVLQSLAQIAKDEIQGGFLLPEFGQLRVVPGPQREFRNPATGQLMLIPGDPIVEYVPDSEIESIFLSQRQPANDRTPTSTVEALPQIRLHKDPTDLAAAGIEPGASDENLSKLGGTPDWIQLPPERVTCCANQMTFFGQLDSNVNDRFNIMDAGRIFVFVCRSCGKATSLVQSF